MKTELLEKIALYKRAISPERVYLAMRNAVASAKQDAGSTALAKRIGRLYKYFDREDLAGRHNALKPAMFMGYQHGHQIPDLALNANLNLDDLDLPYHAISAPAQGDVVGALSKKIVNNEMPPIPPSRLEALENRIKDIRQRRRPPSESDLIENAFRGPEPRINHVLAETESERIMKAFTSKPVEVNTPKPSTPPVVPPALSPGAPSGSPKTLRNLAIAAGALGLGAGSYALYRHLTRDKNEGPSDARP